MDILSLPVPRKFVCQTTRLEALPEGILNICNEFCVYASPAAMFIDPVTSSLYHGAAVPIPTFQLFNIVSASVLQSILKL